MSTEDEGRLDTREIAPKAWSARRSPILLRKTPGGTPRAAAPYGERMLSLQTTQSAGRTWILVRKADDVEGWVDSDAVSTAPSPPRPAPGPEEALPSDWLGYVWPLADTVNLRRKAGAVSPAALIGQVGQQARLRLVDEEQRRTGRASLGVAGAWFHVQVEPGTLIGFVDARWVRAAPVAPKPIVRAERYGINIRPDPAPLDPAHYPRDTHRLPTAAELQGVGWVRFVFKQSGVPDLTDAQSFAHYDTVVDGYRAAGIRSLMILNWESFWGHGPWENGDWPKYVNDFGNYVRRVAQHFQGRVAAYQIWNEGDNPSQPETSVYMSPTTYAQILLAAGRAIKEVDPAAKVVFGGACGGAQANVNYVRQTRAAMHGEWPVDAVGMHPYGQYPASVPAEIPHLTRFGWLRDYLAIATQGLPDPIWITEIGVPIDDWGLADNSAYHWEEIAHYLKGVYAEVEQLYGERIPAVLWFAWSNKMRGSGIVDTHDSPRGPIYSAFFETVRGGA